MKRGSAAQIQQFADDVKNYNECRETAPNVEKILSDTAMASAMLARIAKEVEFYINGDITEQVFLDRYAKIEQELKTKLA
jgi:hypothetical protein